MLFTVVDNVLIPAVERHGLVGENDGTTFSVGRVMNGAKQAHASPAVAARKVLCSFSNIYASNYNLGPVTHLNFLAINCNLFDQFF